MTGSNRKHFSPDTKINSERTIILEIDQEFYIQFLSKASLIELNKSNFHVLLRVEEIIKKWMKLIEKVITS